MFEGFFFVAHSPPPSPLLTFVVVTAINKKMSFWKNTSAWQNCAIIKDRLQLLWKSMKTGLRACFFLRVSFKVFARMLCIPL